MRISSQNLTDEIKARQASAVSDNLHENDFDEGLWSTGLPTSNTTNARSLIGVENFDHLSQAQIIDRTYNQSTWLSLKRKSKLMIDSVFVQLRL